MSKVLKYYSKFRAAEMVKMVVFGAQNDQIWFHVKSEAHKSLEILTLYSRIGYPGLYLFFHKA